MNKKKCNHEKAKALQLCAAWQLTAGIERVFLKKPGPVPQDNPHIFLFSCWNSLILVSPLKTVSQTFPLDIIWKATNIRIWPQFIFNNKFIYVWYVTRLQHHSKMIRWFGDKSCSSRDDRGCCSAGQPACKLPNFDPNWPCIWETLRDSHQSHRLHKSNCGLRWRNAEMEACSRV